MDALEFRNLFDSAPVGLAVLDRDLRFVCCNRALARINGMPARAHIGKSLFDILPRVAATVEGPFQRLFSTGRSVRDLRVDHEKQAGRIWLLQGKPLRTGKDITQVLVSVQDVTALQQVQKALRNTERLFQASQRLNPDSFAILRAIRSKDGTPVDFEWEYANPAAERLAGAGPLSGRKLRELAPKTPQTELVLTRYGRTLASGGTSRVEFGQPVNGNNRWFETTVIGIDRDRIALSFRDITDRKEREEQLALVVHESRHRMKNLLTVVSSLVSQASRTATSVQDLALKIEGQLQSLAGAQDLLSRERYGRVDLEDLVKSALKPFHSPSLVIQPGPPFPVPADAVLMLSLVLHELATNAMKHGALSCSGGRAVVTWSFEDGRTILTWQEQGGPAVVAPQKSGFGSKLLRLIEKRLREGKVDVRFAPTGVVARFSFALLDTGEGIASD